MKKRVYKFWSMNGSYFAKEARIRGEAITSEDLEKLCDAVEQPASPEQAQKFFDWFKALQDPKLPHAERGRITYFVYLDRDQHIDRLTYPPRMRSIESQGPWAVVIDSGRMSADHAQWLNELVDLESERASRITMLLQHCSDLLLIQRLLMKSIEGKNDHDARNLQTLHSRLEGRKNGLADLAREYGIKDPFKPRDFGEIRATAEAHKVASDLLPLSMRGDVFKVLRDGGVQSDTDVDSGPPNRNSEPHRMGMQKVPNHRDQRRAF